jgi:hypothetical protein
MVKGKDLDMGKLIMPYHRGSQNLISWIFFRFPLILGFEFRASYLLGRCSATWAMPLALFCCNYFSDSLLFMHGADLRLCSSYLCLLCSRDRRHMPSCLAYWLRWRFYLPRLALNGNRPNLCLLSSWNYRYEPWWLPKHKSLKVENGGRGGGIVLLS